MSKACIVILSKTQTIPHVDMPYIGVDRGALLLAQKKIPMELAVGDYDSITEEDLALVKGYAKELVQLPCRKEESDSEAAVRILLEQGYDTMYLQEPFGGRFDHSYVNLQLLLQHPQHVILQDEKNRAFVLGEGTHTIVKDGFTYLSIFPLQKSVVTLEGTKYTLQKQTMTESDVYGLSNEIIDEQGTMVIHSGQVLVMQCMD